MATLLHRFADARPETSLGPHCVRRRCSTDRHQVQGSDLTNRANRRETEARTELQQIPVLKLDRPRQFWKSTQIAKTIRLTCPCPIIADAAFGIRGNTSRRCKPISSAWYRDNESRQRPATATSNSARRVLVW